jgi:hypothetical protein
LQLATVTLVKVLNKNFISISMIKFGVVGRGIMFAIVGIVTIIVGSFLLRGNMHMWDKAKQKKTKEDE